MDAAVGAHSVNHASGLTHRVVVDFKEVRAEKEAVIIGVGPEVGEEALGGKGEANTE